MSQPLVSIIIPVYNAEKTLPKTLDSLIRQTYSNLDLVFVNDCSQDNSEALIQDFIEKFILIDGRFARIISHKINRGVAAARNTGLENSAGEYIYYVDADDHIVDKAIEFLVEEAELKNADIVSCSWYLQFHNSVRKMIQPNITNAEAAIEMLSKGVMRWNLWLFMVRKDLYILNNIFFIEGLNMGEDMMVMFKLFSHGKKIATINEALYYYGQSNEESLTKVYSKRHQEEVTANLYELDNYFTYIREIQNWDILINIKLPLLISNNTDQYIKWLSWFPESNKYSFKNNSISKRIQVLQYAANNKQFWILKLHYFVIIKFVYGVVYK
jgi:glycosyltransferase involved in cell wall biosynthesis